MSENFHVHYKKMRENLPVHYKKMREKTAEAKIKTGAMPHRSLSVKYRGNLSPSACPLHIHHLGQFGHAELRFPGIAVVDDGIVCQQGVLGVQVQTVGIDQIGEFRQFVSDFRRIAFLERKEYSSSLWAAITSKVFASSTTYSLPSNSEFGVWLIPLRLSHFG